MPHKDKKIHSEYQQDRKSKFRAKWLLENGPCKCGSLENLEVDHVDPSTKVSHRIWSWSKSRRDEELKKCQPLCVECHKKKTRESRFSKLAHGSSTMYKNHKCKCEKCLEGHRVRSRMYRDRNRKIPYKERFRPISSVYRASRS